MAYIYLFLITQESSSGEFSWLKGVEFYMQLGKVLSLENGADKGNGELAKLEEVVRWLRTETRGAAVAPGSWEREIRQDLM